MVESQKIQVAGSYEDYLINRGKAYEQRRFDEQAKKDMADPESKECTFSPNIYARKGGPEADQSASRVTNSANKWEELY